MSGGEGEILQHPNPEKKQNPTVLFRFDLSLFFVALIFQTPHLRFPFLLSVSQSIELAEPIFCYILHFTFYVYCQLNKFPFRLSVYQKQKKNWNDFSVTDDDIARTFPENPLLGRKLFIYSFRNPHSPLFQCFAICVSVQCTGSLRPCTVYHPYPFQILLRKEKKNVRKY